MPLLVEKPGRTQDEAPRHWHGQSVMRRVEVEYSDGRVTSEGLRFVVVHSSQRAQQQAQTYASAQGKEAEALTDYAKRAQAQWFACLPDAEAALAAYEAKSKADVGAAHVPGAIMPSAIVSWPTPAPRAVRGGAVPPRQIHHR